MKLLEAIHSRHSVRHYVSKPLAQDIVNIIQNEIDNCNREGDLHIQLVLNEKKGFSGMMAYGSFSGVENYIVMAGKKTDDLDERIGYYGERLVLMAQQLGLGTCWAGISYRKIKGTFELGTEEKIACMISLGYPNDPGRKVRKKTPEQISNIGSDSPEWFRKGVEAACLAPSAINQQKFSFEYITPNKVKAKKGFSMIGYTRMDLGIAKLHFEIGAGRENFEWIE